MKFGASHKDVPVGTLVGDLEKTDRYFPCVVCKQQTGWRRHEDTEGGFGLPLCSDECLTTRKDYVESSSDYALGDVAERLKAAVLKTADAENASEGSNPSISSPTKL